MSQASAQIQKISGHPGPVPGANAEPTYTVCKLIDTTTCIGCKACEVACLEWNGYPFRETVFDNSYQTMPQTEWNYWNLIKFNEVERGDGSVSLLMRKDQCMHCAEPGCLAACPADGAIVQYSNGIVDFQQEHCIGCGYCVSGCPFNIPEVQSRQRRRCSSARCASTASRRDSSLRASSLAPPDACISEAKDDMKDLAEHARSAIARSLRIRERRRLRSAGRRRDGRDLCSARCDQSGGIWRFAQGSAYSVDGPALERAGEVDRQSRDGGRSSGRRVSLHAFRSEAGGGVGRTERWTIMSTSHAIPGSRASRIVRYTLDERIHHWLAGRELCLLPDHRSGVLVAIFVLARRHSRRRRYGALLAPMVRRGFSISVLWMYKLWGKAMATTDADRAWSKAMKYYVENEDEKLPPIGRFNYGQKLFFWLML